MHLNGLSVPSHIDALKTLPKLHAVTFDFICFSESTITNKLQPIRNGNVPRHNTEQTSTDSIAIATLMHILHTITFTVLRIGIDFY